MATIVYENLNNAWKNTCRAVLGEEIGELKDYEEWLSEYIPQTRIEKSAISGKPVTLAIPDYGKNAGFISSDEIQVGKSFEPLNINEIKDIDSIVEAVQERILYAGNVILGNSASVEKSSNVIDSRYVYNCSSITSDSKYIAYCDSTREAEYEFGCYSCGGSSHAIKCTEGFTVKRGFESHGAHLTSDAYYSHSVESCSGTIFCFGSMNKRNAIGNLELSMDKYQEIKKKLLSEIVDIIKKEKRIFSLLEIIEKSGVCGDKRENSAREPVRFDKSRIDNAFSFTTQLLFNKELELDSCTKLLKKHIPENIYLKSPISSKETVVGSFLARLFDRYDMRHRTLPRDEIRQIGNSSIPVEKIEKLRMDDINTLISNLADIAFACFDTKLGRNSNIARIALIADCESCYEGSAYISSKKSAYNYWLKGSESIFGSSAMWYSSFCINCYWSKKIQRSFEVDSSESCSNVYFLHNCENVHDSIFCFNAKNLRNAIGNAVLSPQGYKKVKAIIVGQLATELERKGNLEVDIYNVGSIQKQSHTH